MEGSLRGVWWRRQRESDQLLRPPAPFGQVEPRATGTRVTILGPERDCDPPKVLSNWGSQFRRVACFSRIISPATVPPVQKRPIYWAWVNSPPPPLNDETSLTEADRQGGIEGVVGSVRREATRQMRNRDRGRERCVGWERG